MYKIRAVISGGGEGGENSAGSLSPVEGKLIVAESLGD